jgi:hypothetical protein
MTESISAESHAPENGHPHDFTVQLGPIVGRPQASGPGAQGASPHSVGCSRSSPTGLRAERRAREFEARLRRDRTHADVCRCSTRPFSFAPIGWTFVRDPGRHRRWPHAAAN